MAIRVDGKPACIIITELHLIMRSLLLIPMFAILLSNIPLKVEYTIVKENANGCGMDPSVEMSCGMKEAESKRKLCCQSKESTCVCFSCFQFTAPAISITKFVFAAPETSPVYFLYRHPLWENPFIKGPLQPPDFV
jgi:hypothetical protein